MAGKRLASSGALEALLLETRALAGDLEAERSRRETPDPDELAGAARRLRRSVIGPLERAAGPQPVGRASTGGSASVWADRLWVLARDATTARTAHGAPNELLEATAALQDLALEFAARGDPEGTDDRLAELRAIQAGLPTTIRAAANGPYESERSM
jgi:hypothetical protein